MPDYPLPIAAPSWVMPGTMAENARFLVGKVAEIGLCCFEAASSAAMPEEELPASLTDLPLTWHVHLPSDLPADGAAAARAALAVWDRVAFLGPRLAVLHLPSQEAGVGWLKDFLRVWRHKGLAPGLIAVENTRTVSPANWANGRKTLEGLGVFLCLDVGHALAFGQENLWNGPDAPFLMERVRLVHWSAPGTPPRGPADSLQGKSGSAADRSTGGSAASSADSAGLSGSADRHLPLTEWTPEQRRAAETMLKLLPASASHLVEVFQWEGVVQSWRVLRSLPGWRNG